MIMKRKIALMLALLLLLPFAALADEPCTQHEWGEGVVTQERTCTQDGIVTRTCLHCSATKEEVTKAAGHKYGEWYINPQNIPGMLERRCKVCREEQYWYCAPLIVDEFPIAEVLAGAARSAGEKVTLVHEEALLTKDELALLDTLSPHDRMLVVLCAMGYSEQVYQLQLGGDSFSSDGRAARDKILARIDAMTGSEREDYVAALNKYFPAQVISMNPTNMDYQQTYLLLQIGGDEGHTEEYGFSRDERQWSFRRVHEKQ